MSNPLASAGVDQDVRPAQLSDADEACPFPAVLDLEDAASEGGRSTHVAPLDAAEIDALRTLGRQYSADAVVSAVWGLVLSRYTRSRTVLFGLACPDSAVAGEGAPARPMLMTLQPDDTVDELLARAAEQVDAVLTQGSDTATSEDAAPLFDTVVTSAGAPVPAAIPLVLTVDDGAAPTVRLDHDRGWLGLAAAVDLVTAFRTVLRRFARTPSARLHAIALLEPAAGRELVAGTNPPTAAPSEATVVQTFFDQAARRPSATAIVCGEERLTYGELATQVDALADRLCGAGVGPATVVGVFLERSPRLVVGLLAVMRAGGAFLPLDPVLPDRRIALALRDSGARVLLTEALLATRGGELLPPRRRVRTVQVDAVDLAGAGAGALGAPPTVDDLAYVTYTSGSTGVPKGVAIDHRSLATNTRSVAQSYEIDDTDVVVQFSSVNFDAALEQTLLPLTTGATLLQRGPDLWDPVELLAVLRAERATVLELTPHYGYELALALETGDLPAPESLRLLILGGEAVATAELARWRRLMPELRLVVGYGPTEVTITSSGWTYDPEQRVGEVAPLGPPLAHLRAYVVDEDLQLVPRGVPGEICLGGFGVARGYAGQPGLTASSFVPDPFAELQGARMYRSGDVGAWHPHGDLVFLGRSDEQVKIRGTRVEPGESAAALRRRGDVAAAVVVVMPGATGREPARLIGYVTPADPSSPPDPDRMRADLSAELAAAAVPSSIVVLPALPLTANGKLDRDALPRPQTQARPPVGDQTGSSVERLLCEVWSAVLGVPSVGPEDDIFALGGNSLVMLQVSARMKQIGGYDIPLRQFFRHSTASSLARALEARGADA